MTERAHSRQPALARGRPDRSRVAWTTVVALVVATAGVVVQVVAGVGFPTVPPALFLLLIPAGLVYFGRWRWTAIPAVLTGLFLSVGLFLGGESARLFNTDLPGGTGGSVGLWVQTIAVAVAAITAAVTTAQNYWAR